MCSHNGGIYYMLYKGNRVGHCGFTTAKLTHTNLAKNWVLKLANGGNFTITVITYVFRPSYQYMLASSTCALHANVLFSGKCMCSGTCVY